MSKEYAAGFYKSQAWKRCRESYLKSVGYKCEMCSAKGIETPAVIVLLQWSGTLEKLVQVYRRSI